MAYFYPFGKCRRCQWPHHWRVDVPAKPKRPWRRNARPAFSMAVCCNCGLRTPLTIEETK